ncbi:spore germination protein [Cohnella sp. GCM10012308]|uniref:spore germination protein n=1 Tax=Cohnella sp. GCM10012308 TaxID=3317329 RepID=UPI003622B957
MTASAAATPSDIVLLDALDDNLELLMSALGGSSDIKIQPFQLSLPDGSGLRGAVLYAEGLSNIQPVTSKLLSPPPTVPQDGGEPVDWLDVLRDHVLIERIVLDASERDGLLGCLLNGCALILLDGINRGLAVDAADPKARQVEEPNVQSVVRGPREGFTEVLDWNTSMLRRKLRTPDLWMETRVIGRQSRTRVVVAYLNGVVKESVLQEVRRRLDGIDIDAVLESNYIEECIQEKQYSPFPTMFNTERPDVVAADLLEGKVCILVDGTPFVLVVPALFVQFFQSSEDYYQRPDFASLVRVLRFISFFLATMTPSLYIAVTTFHQELIPTTLLYNLASQREGVPFPAFMEGLLMEVTFEILREASVRMPKTIGQSISIVGTLVIGQAAVEAGLVTAGMVIVVSITAISNFVMPAFNMGIAARILRFILMALAGAFGLYGVFLGVIVIIVKLCKLESFGVPYMTPFAPLRWRELRDGFVRVPFRWMTRRPSSAVSGRRLRVPAPERGRDRP